MITGADAANAARIADMSLLGRITILEQAVGMLIATHPDSREIIKSLTATSFALLEQSVGEKAGDAAFSEFRGGATETANNLAEACGM